MNEYHQIRRNSVEAEAVEVAKRAVEEFYSQHGRTRSNLSISKGSTGRNKERKRGGKGDGTGRHASMSMDTRSRHSTPLQQHRSPGCLSAQPKPGGDDGENLQSLPFAAFFEQEEDNPPSPPPSDNHRYQQGQPGVVCASSSPQAVFYRLDANTSTSFAKDTEYSSNTRSHGSHPSARAHSGINTSLDLDTSMESSPASRVGVGARAALRRMAEEDGKRKSGLGRNMSEDGYRENKRGRRDYTRIKSRHQDRGELDGSLNSIGGRSHRSPPPTDLAPTRQRYYSPNTRINKSMHSNSNSILHLNASATIDVDQYAKRLVGDDHVGITVSDHLVRPHDRSRMDQHNRRQICRDNHLTVMVDQMNDYHRRIQFDVEAGNFRPHQKARMYREQKKQQERKQRKQEKEHKYNETKTMLASVSSPSLLLQTSYKLNPANAYGEGSQKSGKRQLVAVMDAIDRLEANTSNISFYQLIQQRAKEEERKEREERERREAGRKKKEKPRINYGSLPPKPSVTIKTTQLDRLNIDSKTINKKAANKAQLLADRYSRSQFSMKHPDKQGYLLRTKHEDYLHNMNYEERMRISENVRDYYLIVFQFDIIPFKNKSGTEDEKEQEMEDFLANATVAQLREVDCNLMEKLEMIKAEEEVLNQRARIRGKVKGTISGLKRKNRKGKERTERGKTIIGAKPAESLTGTAGSSLSAAGKMMVKLSSTQREGQTLNISSLSALVNSVSEKRRAESRNTALSSGSASRGRGGMRSNLAMALRRMPGGKQEEEEDDSDGDGGGGKKGSGKGQTRTQSLQRMETVIGEIRKKNRKRLRSKGSSSKADIKKASVLALARQSMAAMALANAPKGE